MIVRTFVSVDADGSEHLGDAHGQDNTRAIPAACGRFLQRRGEGVLACLSTLPASGLSVPDLDM